jgi:hypothetical protein
VPVGSNNGLGRSLCIGTDGNLWVGLFNAQQYYKISSADGSVLAGPIAVPWTPYGCLVDSGGTLWSASLTGRLGKITNTQASDGHVVSFFDHGGQNYGIALGNGRVFLGLVSGRTYVEFNPATNTFLFPAKVSYAATGISVDADGNIVTGPYGGGGVTKFRWSADQAVNGTVIWNRGTQLNTETRGVIVDANNDVWQVSRTGNSIMKYAGADGAPLGVFPVGNQPYTYSDATGLSQRTQTNPTGTWTVIYDAGAAATQWGTITWNDLVPTGASVQVQARTADTTAGLAAASYQPITKGLQFAATGQFIQIQTRLNASPSRESPILYDLTVSSLLTVCDVDKDGDVDINDINLVRIGIGQTPTAKDPRDANFDGKITINDVRACTLKCTRANCAP